MGEVAEKPSLKAESRELSDFGRRLSEVFREQELGEPKISVRIFSSWHATPKDMEGINDEIANADIYIPEFFGHSNQDLEVLNDSSKGEVPLEKIIRRYKGNRSEIFLLTIEHVYNSQKPIAIIDVPEGNPLTEIQKRANNYDPSPFSNFTDVIEHVKKYLKDNANYQNMREDYMLQQIKPAVEEILKTHPELKNKDQIIILLSIGSAHDHLGDDYSKVGFWDEGVLRNKKGENLNNEAELAARIFIEIAYGNLLSVWLGQQIQDIGTAKSTMFMRKVFSQFELKDAENMFNEINRIGANYYELLNKIKAKNIILPKTEAELDEFLAKPLPSRPNSLQPTS